jgi:ABC-type transport system involved in multi-copper enzyme maturation permease subunit
VNLNPVLTREAKQRFRTRRVALVTGLWVGIIGGIAFLLYIAARQVAVSGFGVGRLAATAFMGRFMFHSITLLLLTAIILVVPGIAAPSIVGERERQTFQILQVTQMTPWQLVTGKLSASMMFAVVLLFAVAPVAAIPLLFGGTSLTDVLAALSMLLLTAITLASIATWMSSRAVSTRGAVGTSYLIAFTLGFLTFAGLGAEMLVYTNLGNQDIARLSGREVYSMLPNPYFALVDAVQHPLDETVLTSDTPYIPFEYMLRLRQGVNPDFIEPAVLGGAPAANAVGRVLPRVPLWMYTVLIYLGLTALSLGRAAINVRAPSRTIRKPKRLKGADA